MRRSLPLSIGKFNSWPWPVKLPLTKNWFGHLSRNESLAQENKQVFIFGDFIVLGICCFALLRCAEGRKSKKHQTRLCHLTGLPPAIIAHEVDFNDIDKHRTVSRLELDAYRQEYATARAEGRDVETFIFKF